MASPSMTLLSMCGMLLFSLCAGITVERGTSHCPCLNWSEVYGENGIQCKAGKKEGAAGEEICKMLEKMDSNVCVEKDFLLKTESAEKHSICYVSGECAGTNGIEYRQKKCSSEKDTLLSEMSVAQTTSLATASGLDQSAMAALAYGAVIVNTPTAPSKEEIEEYKATGEPTLVWSLYEQLGSRLEIKGEEVYKHTFNYKAPGMWEVTCVEGCA
mmetsp:Transcript_123372/g.275481  ORF Transcript_123372/g.275481 Transcript_123372/m.275481 type:complete len:214 (+) Transcript_123372:173-814(+)